MTTASLDKTTSRASDGLIDVPRGLAGVAVTQTEIGDVRGTEGYYHYRQYDATKLARLRTLEDVWLLLLDGALPDAERAAAFAGELAPLRQLPVALRPVLDAVAAATTDGADALSVLRTTLSAAGTTLGLAPLWDGDEASRRDDVIAVAALVPTLLAAIHRRRHGDEPIAPRADLGHTANYLWMLRGEEPASVDVTALQRYLVTTVDHGFNASTFTARVVASTGADAAACSVAGIGALSGPLHGGAPSRALDMLDEIGSPDRAEPWIRAKLEAGERIMGFGHAIYRGPDPRSVLLRETVQELATSASAEGAALVELATAVEDTTLALLAELRPDKKMGTNVEFYAGVLMHLVGVPHSLFSATFGVARSIGWSAHVLEQTRDRKIVRPSARYVGPAPSGDVPV
jgi:citrate synthase